MSNFRESVNQAGLGIQAALVITKVPASGPNYLGQSLLSCGNINVAGTYECLVDTRGLLLLEVHLQPADQVGVPAVPVIASTFIDRSTAKTGATPAPVGMQTGVLKSYSVDLKGEANMVVRFTLGPGESIDFTGGNAEVNGR